METKYQIDGQFDLQSVIESLGISQRRLAKLMGSTQDWIGRLHNGKSSPSWETAGRIARALGVSVGVLRVGDPAREEFFSGRPQRTTGPVEPPPAEPPAKAKRRKRAAG